MSSENTDIGFSAPRNSRDRPRSGEMYPETTTIDTIRRPPHEVLHHAKLSEDMQRQRSGDYPTNPTTEHRYGVDIGTGIYDPNSHNVAHTSYTIRDADFEDTAFDSGEGIHARQYHGREAGSVPTVTTTFIRDSSSGEHDGVIDPDIHARIVEAESSRSPSLHQSEKLRERDFAREPPFGPPSADSSRCERDLEAERRHGSDLQRGREAALAAEREKATKEKIDTTKGSIHGLFGRGRHRDALLLGRDTDATDFGNKTAGKIDAGRDRLSTSGSERDKMIGTIVGRERLAREQDAKINCILAGGENSRYTGTSGTRATSGVPASTAYKTCNDTVPGTGMPGVGSGIHGAGHATTAAGDRSGRSGVAGLGHEGQRHEADTTREDPRWH